MLHFSTVTGLLEHFSVVTDLKINFEKSTQVPIHVSFGLAQSLSAILGFSVSCFLQTYLFLPLSMSKLRSSDMQPLICSHDKYLSG